MKQLHPRASLSPNRSLSGGKDMKIHGCFATARTGPEHQCSMVAGGPAVGELSFLPKR